MSSFRDSSPVLATTANLSFSRIRQHMRNIEKHPGRHSTEPDLDCFIRLLLFYFLVKNVDIDTDLAAIIKILDKPISSSEVFCNQCPIAAETLLIIKIVVTMVSCKPYSNFWNQIRGLKGFSPRGDMRPHTPPRHGSVSRRDCNCKHAIIINVTSQ
jgi:hypothetical protein